MAREATVCRNCGDAFTPISGNQHYCKLLCRLDFHNRALGEARRELALRKNNDIFVSGLERARKRILARLSEHSDGVTATDISKHVFHGHGGKLLEVVRDRLLAEGLIYIDRVEREGGNNGRPKNIWRLK